VDPRGQRRLTRGGGHGSLAVRYRYGYRSGQDRGAGEAVRVERQALEVIEARAIANFQGSFPDLESALGMLRRRAQR